MSGALFTEQLSRHQRTTHPVGPLTFRKQSRKQSGTGGKVGGDFSLVSVAGTSGKMHSERAALGLILELLEQLVCVFAEVTDIIEQRWALKPVHPGENPSPHLPG